jgi:hypothetical protein
MNSSDRERAEIARAVAEFERLCTIMDRCRPVIMAYIRATIGQPAYTYMYDCQVKVHEDGTVSIPALIWSLSEAREYRLTFTLSSDYKEVTCVR